jgi:glycerol-3-phosphate dehydrogenase
MKRSENLRALTETPVWDLIVIGGGATGLGAALDAAARGYRALLLERSDFGKGTSSRSTKLIHGGVRYLEQGNLRLVASALHERWFFLKNAALLANKLPFILPVYHTWQLWYYWLGLKFYDLLSGKKSLGATQRLSRAEVLQRLPYIESGNLAGGVMYYDGQFDDSAVCIALAHTASEYGGVLLNYAEVQSFLYEKGKICGVQVLDLIGNKAYTLRAKGIINATGVFADAVLAKDQPGHQPVITASQGAHIVADGAKFPGSHAMIIPKTSDGRVLFAVPWMGKILIGTTDAAIEKPEEEPVPTEEEIGFILQNFNRYSRAQVKREEIQAAFAGLRPLVRRGTGRTSASLLRDHVVLTSPSGLLTITGGKWTTYRKMAEEAVDKAAKIAGLPRRPCLTRQIRIARPEQTDGLPGSDTRLHPDFSYTEGDVRHAVQHEMAMTIEDILGRRIRLLYLDTAAAQAVAGRIAAILREELQQSPEWEKHILEEFLQRHGNRTQPKPY